MNALIGWWAGLTVLNQCFYGAASFFAVVFVWQLASALMGIGSEDDLDAGPDDAADHPVDGDAHDTVFAFQLISVRSIIAFCTLFTWAVSLHLNNGAAVRHALVFGLLWGTGAMFIVSLIPAVMRRLTETGNLKIASCVGSRGAVYGDIPESGVGEVRVSCNGVLTHLRARTVDGRPLRSGTSVTVVRVLESNTIEVKCDKPSGAKEDQQ
ncbi:MAG: hypothetical protein FJ224_01380 [Lentisphaerae bacterium]|nr:hypothetical protein [Lentisphaerota bacterium]